LPNNNKDSINRLLHLIHQFIEKKIVVLDKFERKDVKIFHYYNEIVRYWSKLNYIFRKTFRSLNQVDISKDELVRYIYSTYRVIFENSSNNEILKELNLSKNQELSYLIFFNKLREFSIKIALKHKQLKEKLSIEEAIPTFVINRLLPVMNFEFLKKNIQFMNNLTKYDNFFRINDFSDSVVNQRLINEIKEELKTYNISIKQDKEIPELYKIPREKKSLVLRSKSYILGKLNFQDKASAAVIRVLSPEPHDYIFDMCAAPGMKTSLISKYSKNQAKIVASDFNIDRLLISKNLFLKSNILNLYLINADSINFPIRFENYFDKILLDAPCTGSGTFLTNPELKWRQNRSFLYQNITIQEKLLKSALRLLKPNGILVYSTCSLYAEEGELQILKFLDLLEALELPKWFSPSYKINDRIIHGTGRLFPSIHHTQGFFIGKFKKKE